MLLSLIKHKAEDELGNMQFETAQGSPQGLTFLKFFVTIGLRAFLYTQTHRSDEVENAVESAVPVLSCLGW